MTNTLEAGELRAILDALKARGVVVSVEGKALKVKPWSAVLEPERTLLQENRSAIAELLASDAVESDAVEANEACSSAPDATSSVVSSEPIEESESVGQQTMRVSASFGRRTPRVFQPAINPDTRPSSLRLQRYYVARFIEQCRRERE